MYSLRIQFDVTELNILVYSQSSVNLNELDNKPVAKGFYNICQHIRFVIKMVFNYIVNFTLLRSAGSKKIDISSN